MYRAGWLSQLRKKISEYKLDLVGVQVRWDGDGTEPDGEYTFVYRIRLLNLNCVILQISFYSLGGGGRSPVSCYHGPQIGLFYQLQMTDENIKNWWMIIGTRKQRELLQFHKYCCNTNVLLQQFPQNI
jgi:hypothetical protein